MQRALRDTPIFAECRSGPSSFGSRPAGVQLASSTYSRRRMSPVFLCAGWVLQHNSILLRRVCDKARLRLLTLRSRRAVLVAGSTAASWAGRFALAVIKLSNALIVGRAAGEVQVSLTR